MDVSQREVRTVTKGTVTNGNKNNDRHELNTNSKHMNKSCGPLLALSSHVWATLRVQVVQKNQTNKQENTTNISENVLFVFYISNIV